MPLARYLIGLLVLGGATPVSHGVSEGEPETIVRFENARVRVVEIIYGTGDVAPQHSHEYPRTVYTISGGTLELVAPDGAAVIVELRDGQTIWRPRETHTVTNVGARAVRVLETEIK